MSEFILIRLLQLGHSNKLQNSFTAKHVLFSSSIDKFCAQLTKCVLGLIVQRSICKLLNVLLYCRSNASIFSVDFLKEIADSLAFLIAFL